VLAKAAQFGAGLAKHAEFLDRQAGRGVPDQGRLTGMIEGRALLVQDPALRAHFRKMAAVIKERPRHALQPQLLVKLAETMDQLDRTLGLVGKYCDGVPRPEDVIFEATFTKAAAGAASVVTMTDGNVWEKESLARLPLADLEALFGTEFSDQVRTPLGEVDAEKLAEVAGTLPRPDATLLAGLMADQGVGPVRKKFASGPTPEERQAWAEAYAAGPQPAGV
jgi:hypothetical protein